MINVFLLNVLLAFHNGQHRKLPYNMASGGIMEVICVHCGDPANFEVKKVDQGIPRGLYWCNTCDTKVENHNEPLDLILKDLSHIS